MLQAPPQAKHVPSGARIQGVWDCDCRRDILQFGLVYRGVGCCWLHGTFLLVCRCVRVCVRKGVQQVLFGSVQVFPTVCVCVGRGGQQVFCREVGQIIAGFTAWKQSKQQCDCKPSTSVRTPADSFCTACALWLVGVHAAGCQGYFSIA